MILGALTLSLIAALGIDPFVTLVVVVGYVGMLVLMESRHRKRRR